MPPIQFANANPAGGWNMPLFPSMTPGQPGAGMMGRFVAPMVGPNFQVGPQFGPPAPLSGISSVLGGFTPPTVGPSSATGPMLGPPAPGPMFGPPVPPGLGAAGPAAAATPGALSRFSNLMPKGGWGKAGLIMGAGVAGNVLGNAAGGQESGLGRFLSGAGTGAGIGAVVGNAIPIPGVGALTGAIGGGIIGGGISLLSGGDKEPDFESRLDELLKGTGIPDEQADELKATYELLVEAGGGGDEAKTQALTTIVNSVMQNQAAQEQAKAAQYEMLSRQAMTAEFFRPLTQQLIESAQTRAAIGERVAADLPPAYRAVAQQQNAAALDNATRTANAYAAQAQLLPTLANLEYQKGLADQIAQQQAAQVMQQMGIGGGGSAGSLADLTAQLAAASQGGQG